MRAIAGPIDQIPPRQQRFDLALREWIAGLHRGLAGHHVEDFVQQFFLVQVEQLLLAALEKLADEISRLKLFEKRWKRLHRDGRLGSSRSGGRPTNRKRSLRTRLAEQVSGMSESELILTTELLAATARWLPQFS